MMNNPITPRQNQPTPKSPAPSGSAAVQPKQPVKKSIRREQPAVVRTKPDTTWYWIPGFQWIEALPVVRKLTESQRYRILASIFGTPILIAMLLHFGVQNEKNQLEDAQMNVARITARLKRAEKIKRQSKEITDALDARSIQLARREANLAPVWDTYSWIIISINSIISGRDGISLEGCTHPFLHDVDIFPNFPYRWATFYVRGNGYYHEIGSFIAEFENTFPCFRIQNVVLTPNVEPGLNPEKINFKFDLVAPVVAKETKAATVTNN